MAGGRRSVKREMANLNNRPTAIELTDSKCRVEAINSNTVSKTQEEETSSSEEESKGDVQEYIHKLEEENELLQGELTKLQRLTMSRPNSLLTVIFPSTQHSIVLKEELNGIIQEFCNRKRDEINAKKDTKSSLPNNQVMSSVEFNDLYSMERYPDTPKSTPSSSTKLPKYSQVYNRIVEPKSNKPSLTSSHENIVQPALKLDYFTRPTRSCFNCGGDHIVSDCSEVKDFAKIRANKQEYLNSQMSEQPDKYPNSENSRSSSGTRSYSRRDDHHHYSDSPSRRDLDREHYRRNSSDRMSRDEAYSRPYYSRENSRDRDGNAYSHSRHQSSYHSDRDSRSSYQGSMSDREVQIRMSSTPTAGSPRDIRMVGYRGSMTEYSSTYGDMELSDQELEDGEIITLTPRLRYPIQPPLPPPYPHYYAAPPPIPHSDPYHTPPHVYQHQHTSHNYRESRRPPPPPHKPYNALSRSMPDMGPGSKRRLSQRTSESMHSRGFTSESSDGISVFRTNEHNFSLDFPPGIVTPESMRAPERFTNIRRIIDRHK